MTGIVDDYFDQRGYGFIRPEGGGEHVFVHRNDIDICNGRPMLIRGQKVTYELGSDKLGRPCAIHVKPI